MKHNFEKHTHIIETKLRILRHIKKNGPITFKSQMGYAAFPDYNFKTPQGIPLHTSLPSIPAIRKKATIRLKIRQIERFLRTFGRCRSCLAAACPHEIFA